MKRLSIFLITALCCSNIFANTSNTIAPEKDWSISLGGIVLVIPKSSVSRKYTILPLPTLDVTWKKLLFASVYRGLGVYLWNKKTGSAGVAANLDYAGSGSYREDFGLKKVGVYPIATFFLQQSFLKVVRLKISGTQDISGHKNGAKLNIGLGLGFPIWLSQKVFGSIGPSMTLANQRYMQKRYGVSAADAASNTALTQYTAKSGIESIGANAAVFWKHNSFMLGGFFNANWLQSAAHNSPLVKENVIYSGGITGAYNWKL
jgi:MipA family protein